MQPLLLNVHFFPPMKSNNLQSQKYGIPSLNRVFIFGAPMATKIPLSFAIAVSILCFSSLVLHTKSNSSITTAGFFKEFNWIIWSFFKVSIFSLHSDSSVAMRASLLSFVHCRIGSLEIKRFNSRKYRFVHCRIGSLEIVDYASGAGSEVHCRIGSLEKNATSPANAHSLKA